MEPSCLYLLWFDWLIDLLIHRYLRCICTALCTAFRFCTYKCVMMFEVVDVHDLHMTPASSECLIISPTVRPSISCRWTTAAQWMFTGSKTSAWLWLTKYHREARVSELSVRRIKRRKPEERVRKSNGGKKCNNYPFLSSAVEAEWSEPGTAWANRLWHLIYYPEHTGTDAQWHGHRPRCRSDRWRSFSNTRGTTCSIRQLHEYQHAEGFRAPSGSWSWTSRKWVEPVGRSLKISMSFGGKSSIHEHLRATSVSGVFMQPGRRTNTINHVQDIR